MGKMNDFGQVNYFTFLASGKMNDIGYVNLTTNKNRDIIQLREVSLFFSEEISRIVDKMTWTWRYEIEDRDSTRFL
ncbi:hypothetical protein [Neobacillus massiliamazoniensis]|uniref:hypothetical protein n=1 Tax=Neobacillus massiliamazoniensis TaxID=1499688 RepID=UPI00159ED767|nr:hypothetical protein [Neobacillus massiliamazoniensis]